MRGAVGEVLRAVQLADLAARRTDRRARQGRGVGTHVGDEAVLVEPLRHRHRGRGAHAELPARLLLEGGGAERRVRRAAVGLRLDRAHVVRRVPQAVDERLGAVTVEVDDLALGGRLQQAVGAEVGAAGDPGAVDGVQLGREHPLVVLAAGVEGALEVPVGREPERHPLPLPVDHQPGGDGLDAAGREAGHDLLPEDRRDLVAVEAVQDPARLLGLDEVHVEVARVLGGGEDRRLGDLVEDHPAHGDVLRLQLVEEVPGDGLALAVLIGGEVELVGVLEQVLQLADLRLLPLRDDVVGLEAVLDVDREPAPGLVLDLRRGVGSALREVTDVADRGLDDVVPTEEAPDLLGLRRRLDDHQLVCHWACFSCHCNVDRAPAGGHGRTR